MSPKQIQVATLRETISTLNEQFKTKDVSEHALMRRAHSDLVDARDYHKWVGRAISMHRETLGLEELRKGTPRGSLWGKINPAAGPERVNEGASGPARPSVRSRKRVVRPGHYETLDYMETPAFAGVKALFEQYDEIGGVYFRPIDRRATVVDLSETSLKPRVGVGTDPYVPVGCTYKELLPTMNERIEHLRRVRARQSSPSQENQLEARLIKYAQANGLRLPGFPDRIRFINSQWRLQVRGKQNFADLLAIDLQTAQLVVIELKREADRTAFDQVADYVEWFDENADEVAPFFHRVGRVMGKLYGCPELIALDDLCGKAVGLVAWPGNGGIEVHGLESLGTEPSQTAADEHLDIGPQASSDNAFTKRMRLHQSWYRASVLRVPYGVGPKAHSTSHRGSMLTAEDGERGKNFLTDDIYEVACERLALNTGTVEPYRLKCNMLSSQPMCFNLFGPLVHNLDLATRLWRQLLGDEVARVERVAIEWAPTPEHEYLDDKTAFDAFIEYRRPDGQLAFVGIETKLTEPFSQKHTDKPSYRRWMTPESPWRPDAHDRVDDIRHNQLWRDHLLAVATLRHPRSPYAGGRLMLVRHPLDTACATTVAGYKGLLRAGDESFVDLPLDELIEAWGRVVPDHARAWLDAFALRYLELNRSVGA